MEDGQFIAHVTTSKGLPLTLRYPRADDLLAMLEFINTLSAERTFLHVQGKQFTLDEERAFLEGVLDGVRGGRRVQVMAFAGHELVGNTEIERDGFESNSHRGGLGIAVAARFRGQGVGEALMRAVLNEATLNLPGMEVVLLTVFGNNPVAIHLYEKLGFVEYGRLPRGFMHRGEYVDEVYMAKWF